VDGGSRARPSRPPFAVVGHSERSRPCSCSRRVDPQHPPARALGDRAEPSGRNATPQGTRRRWPPSSRPQPRRRVRRGGARGGRARHRARARARDRAGRVGALGVELKEQPLRRINETIRDRRPRLRDGFSFVDLPRRSWASPPKKVVPWVGSGARTHSRVRAEHLRATPGNDLDPRQHAARTALRFAQPGARTKTGRVPIPPPRATPAAPARAEASPGAGEPPHRAALARGLGNAFLAGRGRPTVCGPGGRGDRGSSQWVRGLWRAGAGGLPPPAGGSAAGAGGLHRRQPAAGRRAGGAAPEAGRRRCARSGRRRPGWPANAGRYRCWMARATWPACLGSRSAS